MTLSCAYYPFLLHLSKLFGQGTSFKVKVVGQLLTVKGNVEFFCSILQGNGVEIGHDPSADRLWGSMKASSGENEVFSGGYQ